MQTVTFDAQFWCVKRKEIVEVEFDIKTDKGKRFCSCRIERETIVFRGKNGDVNLGSVVQQIIGRDPMLFYKKERQENKRRSH